MFLSVEEFLESLIPEFIWPFTRFGTAVLAVAFIIGILLGLNLAL